MGYGVKRLLEIEAERQRKREEKARIKAEKEKKKKEEKRIARKKKLKKKQNAKYYAKVKAAREKYHESIGDEKGIFSIILMKNGRRSKYIGRKNYRVAATQWYYQLLEENNSKVTYPKTIFKTHDVVHPMKYELLLIKTLKEDDGEDYVTLFRNKDGKFVESMFVDSTSHKIIEKNEWFIEETFGIYGYDNITDRKDFNFILNEIILKKSDVYSRVMIYRNRLIFHYDTDFDIITCKNNKQSEELYDRLEKAIDKKKYPTIFFMGHLKGSNVSWIIDEISKKTGWSRNKIMKR